MAGLLGPKSKMKLFLLISVCVALVSYHGAQGEEKADERDDLDDQEEDSRRQFSGPYPLGLNTAQASAQAAANANGKGVYRPPPPRPTLRPKPYFCHSCVDCPDPTKLLPQNVCATYNDEKCVIYEENYGHRKKPVTVRGCVSERGSCEDIKRSHEKQTNVKLASCVECVGDRCNTNGVARSLPDLTAALFFVVLAPILTKYALS